MGPKDCSGLQAELDFGAKPRRKPKFSIPKEHDVQRAILNWLEHEARTAGDLLAWRCNSGAVCIADRFIAYGLGKGCADIIVVLAPYGRMLGLEVKRPGEKAQPHQVAWGKDLEAKGGLYRVVTSVREAKAAIAEGRGYDAARDAA